MPYITSIEELGFRRGQALGRQEGRMEGRQQGREEGRQQGREEGREEGRQQGREEGRQEADAQHRATAAEILVGVLHRRFGLPPAEIKQQIDLSDLTTLCVWTARAGAATNLEAVFNDSQTPYISFARRTTTRKG